MQSLNQVAQAGVERGELTDLALASEESRVYRLKPEVTLLSMRVVRVRLSDGALSAGRVFKYGCTDWQLALRGKAVCKEHAYYLYAMVQQPQ